MKQQNKYCPMSLTTYNDMIGCKGPACAWYVDGGCAIMVLATQLCANLHELQDMVKIPDDDSHRKELTP